MELKKVKHSHLITFRTYSIESIYMGAFIYPTIQIWPLLDPSPTVVRYLGVEGSLVVQKNLTSRSWPCFQCCCVIK
jgi:hypothetical protein